MTKKSNRIVVTAAEAKSQFAESLRHVDKGNIVLITRYGKPVAALVSPENVAQLDRLVARVPEEDLARLAGRWKDSGELSSALDDVVERRSTKRQAPEFERD
jgi:prevent-host-death family protein